MNRMTPELLKRIDELLAGGICRREVAITLGVNAVAVGRAARGFYRDRLKPREESAAERAKRLLRNWHPAGPTPTPEEIDETCNLLRPGRNTSERLLATGGA